MATKVLNFNLSNPNNEDYIKSIASNQLVYFRTQQISDKVYQCEKLLLKFFHCKDGRVVFLTGSGTAGMEATISNFISKTDRVLVINGGTFGRRWVEIGKAQGLNIYDYNVGFGKDLYQTSLEKVFDKFRPTFVLMQHVETSSGQLYDVKAIGDLSRKYSAKLIVDSMTGFLVHSTNMDKWGVYAAITSSNKGLCLYPGMSFIVLSKEAVKDPKLPTNLYYQFTRYLQDFTELYFPFTPNTMIIDQLYARLVRLQRTGVDSHIQKVEKLAQAFREKISKLPLVIAAETPANCCTVLYTDREDLKTFFRKMKQKKIFFTPSGGDKGKVFFVGHLGDLKASDYDEFVRSLEKWLNAS